MPIVPAMAIIEHTRGGCTVSFNASTQVTHKSTLGSMVSLSCVCEVLIPVDQHTVDLVGGIRWADIDIVRILFVVDCHLFGRHFGGCEGRREKGGRKVMHGERLRLNESCE